MRVINIYRKFEFYEKHKEAILYLFFGALTFAISVVSYTLFLRIFYINELVANIFSWIIAVMFAYLTNRKWVFKSIITSLQSLVKEMISFFIGRVGTLIIEEVILYIFITRMAWNSILIKIIAQVIVIFLNYVISKLLIFGGKD